MPLLADLGVSVVLFASTVVDDVAVPIGIGAMVPVEAGIVSSVTGRASRG